MPDLDLTLARRATEIPGWRWMTGMLAIDRIERASGMRILAVTEKLPWLWRPEDCRWTCEAKTADERRGAWNGWGPDYRDPATAGCLEELLGPDFVTGPDGTGRFVTFRSGRGCSDPVWSGEARGEARINAAIALGRWPGGTP